jgi:hypothetical protein
MRKELHSHFWHQWVLRKDANYLIHQTKEKCHNQLCTKKSEIAIFNRYLFTWKNTDIQNDIKTESPVEREIARVKYACGLGDYPFTGGLATIHESIPCCVELISTPPPPPLGPSPPWPDLVTFCWKLFRSWFLKKKKQGMVQYFITCRGASGELPHRGQVNQTGLGYLIGWNTDSYWFIVPVPI